MHSLRIRNLDMHRFFVFLRVPSNTIDISNSVSSYHARVFKSRATRHHSIPRNMSCLSVENKAVTGIPPLQGEILSIRERRCALSEIVSMVYA